MQGDVHVCKVLVECTVDRGAVGFDGETWGCGFLGARDVGERGVGRGHELLAYFHFLVAGCPEGGGASGAHGPASWVAVPFFVGDRGVADCNAIVGC